MATSNKYGDIASARTCRPARADTSMRGSGFERFAHEQYRELVVFLKRRTATVQDAEDAAQESMARMLRYQESTPASAWQRLLYRIAINVAHDQHRSASTHRASQHVPLDEHALVSPERSPEQQAAHEQQLALLRAAIKALPPKCQQVYLLKRVHGMSHAEVAQHCGISVKTVEKHLTTALKKLRQKVGHSASGTFE